MQGVAHDAAQRRRVPVDGHVHLHRRERVSAALDAAAANFRACGAPTAGRLGVLLLTQAQGERVFEELVEQPGADAWRVHPCPEEPQSLLAERDDSTIVVVCGRQIRCERGLEVTALGTRDTFADGDSLDATIARVQASGALAVLPWGFGKWTGSRGATVRRALQRHSPADLAVCDNGGRMALLGQPALIREAASMGLRVLPGSDPFPFAGDYRRTGAFGFFADLIPDSATPWRDLAAWLASHPGSPPAYGQGLGPVRFVRNNIGIQLYNRLKSGAAA